MKVKTTNYGLTRCTEVRDLAEALQPQFFNESPGQIEEVQAHVEACSEAIGRILAALVDSGFSTVQEAAELAGYEGKVEVEQ